MKKTGFERFSNNPSACDIFVNKGDSMDSKGLFYLGNNGINVQKFRVSFIHNICEMLIQSFKYNNEGRLCFKDKKNVSGRDV